MKRISILLISGLLAAGCTIEAAEDKDETSAGTGGSNEAGSGGSSAWTAGNGGSSERCTNPRGCTSTDTGVAGTSGDSCDPVGSWIFTITPTNGDCIEGESIDVPLSVANADLGADFDDLACELEATEYTVLLDETVDEYGIGGDLTMQIAFAGDEASGAAVLDGELLEGGDPVDYCDQEFDISGVRTD